MRLIDADALRADAITRSGGTEFAFDNCYPFWQFSQAIAQAPTIEAAPVVHGRWEWFEEWSPSTPDAPRECESAGWRCGRCKNALEDMVGGYWDNPDEEPNLNYCPNCGAKMDGGVSDG